MAEEPTQPRLNSRKVRASIRLDGATAPTCLGRVSRARRKRRLSVNGSLRRTLERMTA